MTEPTTPDQPVDEPDATEGAVLPGAEPLDDADDIPDWVPPRIPDFEEGPHGDE